MQDSHQLLYSDGDVLENGTLVTTAGALRTFIVLLNLLQVKERERREEFYRRQTCANNLAQQKKERDLQALKKDRICNEK